MAIKPPSSKTPKADQVKALREARADEAEKRKRAPAGSFDRKAYQRELMRKRRSGQKTKS